MSGGFLAPLFLLGLGGGEGGGPEPTTLPDVAWVNGSYALILAADERGVVVGELRGTLSSLSWQLNDVGQAQLTVAPAAADLVEFGNQLLVYLDNGLPTWAGVVDPPRSRRYGSVEVTAYSGERLLLHRLTGRNRVFTQANAGAVVRQLLAEQAGPAVVEVGVVDIDGAFLTVAYHYEDLLTVLQDGLVGIADFDVTGMVVAGRIRFRLNLYRRRGRELANIWLLEGHNAALEVEEQGPIVNEWLTAGAGNTWGDAGRVYGYARDAGSAPRYGLRQDSRVYSGVRDQATLDALTGAELAGSAEPYMAVSGEAINLPPARFGDYDIGDVVGVEVYSAAWSGRRRVVGREFQASNGVCRLVLA